MLGNFLLERGFKQKAHPVGLPITQMEPGTFSFHHNVFAGASGKLKVQIDAVIQRFIPNPSGLPILLEAKSAGDFANTNKRWKEEATKLVKLRDAYGNEVEFVLLLCGYFGNRYLELAAGEDTDWIWEHRISDLNQLGISP